MLAKLLKYDFKYIYKTFGVYYLVIILCVLLYLATGIPDSSGIIEFIHLFIAGAGFGLSIGMVFNAITRSWMRFQKNFYQEESYLTHTLPVTKSQLLLSKAIASFVTFSISLALLILCILVTQPGLTAQFGEIDAGLKLAGSSLLEMAIAFVAVVVLQQAFIIQCGYAGIVIGHRQNEYRALWSGLVGVGIYVAVIILVIGILLLWGMFNPDVHDLIFTSNIWNPATLRIVAIAVGILYLGAIVATYFITQKVFERGVDVE